MLQKQYSHKYEIVSSSLCFLFYVLAFLLLNYLLISFLFCCSPSIVTILIDSYRLRAWVQNIAPGFILRWV